MSRTLTKTDKQILKRKDIISVLRKDIDEFESLIREHMDYEPININIYIDSFIKGFTIKMVAICEELHKHPKEVKDMTEDEQFAIYYASGADIETKIDEKGNLTIIAKYPCSIVRDSHNHYTVATKQPPKYSSED